MLKNLSAIMVLSLILAFCPHAKAKTGELSEQEVKALIVKTLQENPEILFEIFKDNAEDFILSITEASEIVRADKLKDDWEKDLKSTKNFELEKRPVLGNPKAKNTIVGFSDFLCTYCAQGAETIEEIINSRNDIKFIFKAVPHNPASVMATTWFYHIYQIDSDKAWQFHNKIFSNQESLVKKPNDFLKSIATDLGFDADKMEVDIRKNNKMLNGLIEEDMRDAAKYDLLGTPSFVVNGIIIKGAYPRGTFEKALEFSNL